MLLSNRIDSPEKARVVHFAQALVKHFNQAINGKSKRKSKQGAASSPMVGIG